MDTQHHLLYYISENLPWEFAATIYRRNLPWLFAVRIRRRNLPWKFAENLSWLFTVGFCICKQVHFYICKQILFIWKQTLFICEKNFICEVFFINTVPFCYCRGSDGPPYIIKFSKRNIVFTNSFLKTWGQNHRVPGTYVKNDYINVIKFMRIKWKHRSGREHRKRRMTEKERLIFQKSR